MSPPTATDLADAGRLIGWAARPKDRPARSVSYREVVDKYLDNQEFADLVDQVAVGAGLTIIVDRAVGVVAIAEEDSPLREPLSSFMKKANVSRAMAGLVILAIVKTAYPLEGQIDDAERVPRVSVYAVTDYVNRLVEGIAASAGDPDADHPENSELFRAWSALRHARSELVRSSTKDRPGLVNKVCQHFENEGLLTRPGPEDGGTWRVTPRFRIVAKSVIEDSAIFTRLMLLTQQAQDGTTDAMAAPLDVDDDKGGEQ